MQTKTLKKFFAIVFVFSFCFTAVAFGADEFNKSLSLPSGETVPTDLIDARETVDVASNVNGDVILAGANVSFSGNAVGDIILAGGNVRNTGNSEGNARIAGGNITLDGNINKNVTIVGGSVIIGEGSVINGNLYVAGGSVEMRGKVNGNAKIYSSSLVFSGKVAKNADFRSEEIITRPDASIGGDLTYASRTDDITKSGIVKGSVNKAEMPSYVSKQEFKKEEKGIGIVETIWKFLSLLVVGFAFFKLFGKQAKELIAPIEKGEVWQRAAYGLLSVIFSPIVIVLTVLSLIGIPLSFVILFLYIVLMIAASVLSPVLLARLLNARFKLYTEENRHLWIDFTVGFLLMEIIRIIPVLGALGLALLFLFSFGRITKYVVDAVKANR